MRASSGARGRGGPRKLPPQSLEAGFFSLLLSGETSGEGVVVRRGWVSWRCLGFSRSKPALPHFLVGVRSVRIDLPATTAQSALIARPLMPDVLGAVVFRCFQDHVSPQASSSHCRSNVFSTPEPTSRCRVKLGNSGAALLADDVFQNIHIQTCRRICLSTPETPVCPGRCCETTTTLHGTSSLWRN